MCISKFSKNGTQGTIAREYSLVMSLLSAAEGTELVRFARAAIRESLGGESATPPHGDWCDRSGAVFVTLRRKDGGLHGCVGSLEPRRPLVADVRANAVASALDDPRAPAIALEDLENLNVEI